MLLVVVMAASPFFISTQAVAICQSLIKKYEEVSVECSSTWCGVGVAMFYLAISGICV